MQHQRENGLIKLTHYDRIKKMAHDSQTSTAKETELKKPMINMTTKFIYVPDKLLETLHLLNYFDKQCTF